jgi:hypothetical protein
MTKNNDEKIVTSTDVKGLIETLTAENEANSEAWEASTKPIYAELETVSAPFSKKRNKLSEEIRAMNKKYEEMFRSEQEALWESRIPSLFTEPKGNYRLNCNNGIKSPDDDVLVASKELLLWYRYSKAAAEIRKENGEYIGNELVGRQPKSIDPNQKIVAAVHYNDKLYICFNVKTQKLVAWMKVEPSAHIGDNNTVRSSIKGISGYGVKQPLRTWLISIGAQYPMME